MVLGLKRLNNVAIQNPIFNQPHSLLTEQTLNQCQPCLKRDPKGHGTCCLDQLALRMSSIGSQQGNHFASCDPLLG